jgi:hypothetical protein
MAVATSPGRAPRIHQRRRPGRAVVVWPDRKLTCSKERDGAERQDAILGEAEGARTPDGPT